MSQIIRARRMASLASCALVLAGAIIVAEARPAAALPFTVTQFDDPAPDGICDADCPLRDAILASNASVGADTITVPAGTYTLSRPGSDDIAAFGDLDITGQVTITGAGAGSTTIDGNGVTTNDRVFDIRPGGDATISGLKITGGQHPAEDGGGIKVGAATLVLTDSVVTGNTSEEAGGGIVGSGSSTVSLTGVAISDNQALGGGGLFLNGNAALVNVTISHNAAEAAGGGILTGSGTTTINNTTVTGNTADSDSVLVAPPEAGGGIARLGGTVTVRNTIVAGNKLGTVGADPDCSGTITSQGYNLVQNTTGCSGLGGPGDLTGVDPLLGPLATQGGPTPTHAPLPGSPAVDHGSPTAPGSGGDACATTDQRGVARPQLVGCDIGAHEVQASELPTCFGKAPTAVGTDGPDAMKTTSKADVILGFGDKDVVNASGGNDRVCGGDGNDKLKGAAGKDKLKGEKGKDTCIGGSGKDKAVTCERLKTIP